MMKSTASIEQKIKMFSMSKTDNSYYLKGKAFIELAEITNEKKSCRTSYRSLFCSN